MSEAGKALSPVFQARGPGNCVCPLVGDSGSLLRLTAILPLTDGVPLVRHQPRGHSPLPGVPHRGHSHLPAVPCHSQQQHLPAPALVCVSLPGQASVPRWYKRDQQPGPCPVTSLSLLIPALLLSRAFAHAVTLAVTHTPGLSPSGQDLW